MSAGYRIKTVASITGVPRNTLLAWERRYAFVSPNRGDNRYRLYSEADVTLIREVKELVDRGHPVSEAVGMVKARSTDVGGASDTVPQNVLDEAVDALFQALLAFDRERAEERVAALGHVSYEELLDRVFFPLLVRVGDGWEAGTVTVVQEHFASAFCRDHLVAMLLRLGCGPASGPRAVCAALPEDTHELGLLGVSIQLALRGWRVTHLGARVPEDQLRAFLAEYPAKLVCVSATVPIEKKDIVAYARRVRKAIPSTTRLAIGGSGLPVDLDPQAVPGVDFVRDVTQLV
jgi:DNA-binding transcriptional MerR regulator